MKKLIRIELGRALKNKFFIMSLAIGLFIVLSQIILLIIPVSMNMDAILSKPYVFPSSVYNKWLGMESQTVQAVLYYLLLPILASIPFADSFYTDKKSGYLKNILIRTDKNKYYISKYIAVFLSGGLAFVIPLIISFATTGLFLPYVMPDVFSHTYPIWDYGMWSDIFYSNPLVYTILYFVMDFLFAGVIATLALLASFYVDYKFVVLLSPFLVYLFFYFVTRLFGFVSYNPTAFLKPDQGGVRIYFPIIAVIFCVTFLVSIIFIIKGKKDEIY